MNFFRAKASPSKQATVAFPGLNYDITRFASIFRVGNGYCGINIEKTRFAPDKKANRSIGFLVIYIYTHVFRDRRFCVLYLIVCRSR